MAQALIPFLIALLLAPSAQAQIKRDPTQPPPAYTTEGGVVEPERQVTEHVLQSIVRQHGAKPLAMINGQIVRLGGKIDDWTLVRIGESEVVLKGPDGNETLMMSPAVEKQSVRPAVSRRQR